MNNKPGVITLIALMSNQAAFANPVSEREASPPTREAPASSSAVVYGFEVAADGQTTRRLEQRVVPIVRASLPTRDKSLVDAARVRAPALPDRIETELWNDLNGPPASTPSQRVQREALVVSAMPSHIDMSSMTPLVARSSADFEAVTQQRRNELLAFGRQRAQRFDDLTRQMNDEGCVDVRVSDIADLVFGTCDLDSVRAIALHDDVRMIQRTRDSLRVPLGDNDWEADDPSVVRGTLHLNTDPVLDALDQTAADWYVGFADTGLNEGHVSFTGVNTYALDCITSVDCYDDTANPIPGWDPGDCFEGDGHGTPIGSILGADDTWGESHRGITNYGLSSYKIFSGCTWDDIEMDVEAFERSVTESIVYDSVLNLSWGSPGDPETDPDAMLADGAFDAGVVVVAASGNETDLNCPACAHKVLGVGMYNLNGWPDGYSPIASSGRGYTPDDGRIKPDVVGPYGYEAASALGSDSFFIFTGTSSASPAVAGAAALARTQILENTGLWEPGFTYASMILHGRGNQLLDPITGDTAMNPDDGGAGAVRMDSECTQYAFSKVTLDTEETAAYIDVEIDDTYQEGIHAAIWWPQDIGQTHNDIDLVVYQDDPDDPDYMIPVTDSTLGGSVFEKVSTPTFLAQGTYQVAVEAWTLGADPQDVYVAIRKGGCSFAPDLMP